MPECQHRMKQELVGFNHNLPYYEITNCNCAELHARIKQLEEAYALWNETHNENVGVINELHAKIEAARASLKLIQEIICDELCGYAEVHRQACREATSALKKLE
jgi:hypothetical protein